MMSRTPDTKTKMADKVSLGAAGPQPNDKASPLGSRSNVRRSIGEWEAGRPDSLITISPPKRSLKSVISSKPKVTTVRGTSVEATGSPPKSVTSKSSDRVAEARSWVTKAKIHLSKSGNLKREIKEEVHAAIDRLYQLVKEAESTKNVPRRHESDSAQLPLSCNLGMENQEDKSRLETLMGEHMKLLRETNGKMDVLSTTLASKVHSEENTKTQCEGINRLLGEVHELRQIAETRSYASAAAAPPKRNLPEQTALHSVVVSSKDELETGEEVLNKIRTTINAKEGGINVDRVRKAKDAKVIVTCRTVEERQKLKDRLSKSKELTVEEIKNKDPLVILRDVLQYNSDDEVLRALKNQNESLFKNLPKEDDRCTIAYKKRTRNPHTCHIVLRVSPKLWQAMTVAETVHIDLQRVRVTDQSPLVQCSLCLGYGHGRRFCTETLEKCSHCGGPHLKDKCSDWLTNAPASCCNCVHAKQDKTDHNAFSNECAIRRKWEALARATIAYC